ncbi:MAG TPA: hypothetical protein VF773_02815 [Verrucomicrobiae bacterium]
MKTLLAIVLLSIAVRASTPETLDVLVVVGAPGEESFRQPFTEAAQDWAAAAEKTKKKAQILVSSENETNQIAAVREIVSAQTKGEQELWIVLIGHGTFDGREAKFNLAGPDISAPEMAELLKPIQRPLVLINAASASAPFVNALSGTNRVIITATRSGHEQNLTRFGSYIGKAIADLTSDLDKDGQVSALEAFLMASRNVEDFYKSEKRLATEHALIDDNGDGKGTPATFFSGVRPAKKPDEAANVDGFRAHQIHFIYSEEEARLSPEIRRKRNELELQLEQVRARKQQLKEDEYLKEIEPILLQLSRLYRDAAGKSTNSPAAITPE